MSLQKPPKAFILAAGLGSRMRPITDTMPKPMVEVGGRSLIYRTLDHLRAASVREVMVNTHHKAEILAQHLQAYPHSDVKILISHEPELLDTGGGVTKILDFFEDRPFYVIAGDNCVEVHPPELLLRLLAQQWDDSRMDILTYLQPLSSMRITPGVGDYDLLPSGLMRRSRNKTGAMMWTNIRLNHPRLYKGMPEGPYSFLTLLDAAEKVESLFGLECPGPWHHLSTPEDVAALNAAIAGGTVRL